MDTSRMNALIEGPLGKKYNESKATKSYSPSIPLERVEMEWISKALKHHEGNLAAAAKSLGVSRGKLYRRIEQVSEER